MFQEENLCHFLDTAIERHNIYIKKEGGKLRPWTKDPIFQNFFFCNVFRQYDKCSKWIIENIVPTERWDLIILYRFISTYKLFEEIKENCPLDDLDSIEGFLRYKKNIRKEKLFNGCFIRNPRIKGGWVETYKAPFILIKRLRVYNSRITPYDFGNKDYTNITSLEDMVNCLKNFPGVGGFMAYEYACDFEYLPSFNPTDKYTWANKGPGAEKGLSYLVYGNPKHKFNEKDWLKYIKNLYPIMHNVFRKNFPDEDFSMREVEHWLCEYQKYRKYYLMLNNSNHKVKYRKYNGV